MAEKPPKTNGWIPKMMGLGKGGTFKKYGHFLVSMLDFWGVYKLYSPNITKGSDIIPSRTKNNPAVSSTPPPRGLFRRYPHRYGWWPCAFSCYPNVPGVLGGKSQKITTNSFGCLGETTVFPCQGFGIVQLKQPCQLNGSCWRYKLLESPKRMVRSILNMMN